MEQDLGLDLWLDLWLYLVILGLYLEVILGIILAVRLAVSYFIIHRFVIHVERYTCWTVIHVGAPGIVV